MTKFCPRCGAPNEDYALYCSKCGAALPNNPQGPQQWGQKQHSSNQYLPPKKSRKKWGITGSVIAVIVIIIIVIVAIQVINYTNNNVNVTAINWTHTYYYESGNYPPTIYTFSDRGFNATAGNEEIITLTIDQMLIAGQYPLTINSIATNTQGFIITDISPSLPFTINFGNASISITIQLPTNSYMGVLSMYTTETINN